MNIPPPVQTKPIPEVLQRQNFSKTDLSFFLDKLPESTKTKDSITFMKIFSLYLDGILTQYEVVDLTSQIMGEDSEQQFDYLK